jgi:hypothetical protein
LLRAVPDLITTPVSRAALTRFSRRFLIPMHAATSAYLVRNSIRLGDPATVDIRRQISRDTWGMDFRTKYLVEEGHMDPVTRVALLLCAGHESLGHNGLPDGVNPAAVADALYALGLSGKICRVGIETLFTHFVRRIDGSPATPEQARAVDWATVYKAVAACAASYLGQMNPKSMPVTMAWVKSLCERLYVCQDEANKDKRYMVYEEMVQALSGLPTAVMAKVKKQFLFKDPRKMSIKLYTKFVGTLYMSELPHPFGLE